MFLSTAVGVVVGLGVLGSLFTITWRIVGDAVRCRRERKGLLTLLARDFELYEQLWEDFERHQSWVVRVPDHLLSTKVWEDNRARISQLLKKKEFMDMVRLFQNIGRAERGTQTS